MVIVQFSRKSGQIGSILMKTFKAKVRKEKPLKFC